MKVGDFMGHFPVKMSERLGRVLMPDAGVVT